MSAHNGGVNHHVFVVRIACQRLENSLENAALGPSAKALVHDLPVAETHRQISPGNSRSISVKNRVNEQPVVCRSAADMSFPAGQEILDPLPLVVSLVITEYELYSDERKDTPRGYLILGGVVCTDRGRERLLAALAKVRSCHSLDREIHWRKTSAYCLNGYKAWIDVFFDDPHARYSILMVDRASCDWLAFCKGMQRTPHHDEPLASVYYQFLLTTFGRLHDTSRWWVFPDAGYFSKDEILKRVEFLFNRTYKRAFGSKSSRVIRLARALDSKRSDLVQLADIILACSAISQFSLTPKSPAKKGLVEHFQSRQNSGDVTQRGLKKLTLHTWVPPQRFPYPR